MTNPDRDRGDDGVGGLEDLPWTEAERAQRETEMRELVANFDNRGGPVTIGLALSTDAYPKLLRLHPVPDRSHTRSAIRGDVMARKRTGSPGLVTSAPRPMSEFDPAQRCWIHEQLNEKTFEWQPVWELDYRRKAYLHAPEVINWDGLLLDGWWPWSARPAGAIEGWPWASPPPDTRQPR